MDYKDQQLLNNEFKTFAKQNVLLPIKVTSFYQRKVEDEVDVLGHCEGPLHRNVYPTKERMIIRAPSEVADFVDDRKNMPIGLDDTAVRKYKDRMLFFPTQICAAHCQYCFRQDVLSELHDNAPLATMLDENLAKLLQYLEKHPDVQEIILSGGDPMTLAHDKLEKILTTLKLKAQVSNIRIHTRTIIFSPKVFNPLTIKLLKDFDVRLVFHITHPYEICREVEEYINQLRLAGVRLYNQFPILRKINDHPEVLKRHLIKLDELSIRNLSMFIPDPINYSASFRIRLERLFSIIDELNWTTPSWVNSTRLVLDTPYGKVRREDLIHYDKTDNIATFERCGSKINYPDLPKEMDYPGELATLLWKG